MREGGTVRVLRHNELLGELPAGDGPITLTTYGQDYVVSSGDQKVVVDGRFLSSESAGGFVGVWFGLAAISDAKQRVQFRDVTYGAHLPE